MYQSNIYQYLEELNSDKFIICKNDKEAKQIETVGVFLGFDVFVLPDVRRDVYLCPK